MRRLFAFLVNALLPLRPGLTSLPRKNNVDRKLSILDFLVRSRQMYVKLLALVKWSSDAGEIHQSTSMQEVLLRQDNLFRTVADNLYEMHGGLVRVKYALSFAMFHLRVCWFC